MKTSYPQAYTLDSVWLPFILVTFLFMVNALFNSLAVSYGVTNYQLTSMMFLPADIHADLVKYAMSFSPYNSGLDVASWDAIYKNYYQYNPYRPDNQPNVTGLPFYVTIALFFNKIIFHFSPAAAVKVFYVLVASSVFVFNYVFIREWRKALVVSLLMLASYPVLFMLTRGHIFSFVGSMLLMSFFVLLLNPKYWKWTVLSFSLLINIRLNGIIFSALFLVYGVKKGAKYLILAIALAFFEWVLVGELVRHFIAKFEIFNFFTSVSSYVQNYVYGNGGSQYNNSFYGGVRWFYSIFNIALSLDTLKQLNLGIMLATGMLGLFSMALYWKRKIKLVHFFFVISALYVLGTPIFTTYHMLFLFGFLLIYFRSTMSLSTEDFIILFAIIFVLSPKGYFYINNVSIETLLNPLVLFVSLCGVLLLSLRNGPRSVEG
ncbi:hypothetical protein [Hydrogenovibrio kuenenii]|uniref:hypothetical protein n=1 Tax=Hydrogenovibrio kuenenii TaxID=63658 RepID=UPI0004664496|nr:hypothetical protein [Hydrogenovibrio kuenenii]